MTHKTAAAASDFQADTFLEQIEPTLRCLPGISTAPIGPFSTSSANSKPANLAA